MPSRLVNKIMFEGILKEVGELKDSTIPFEGPFEFSLPEQSCLYKFKYKEDIIQVIFENASTDPEVIGKLGALYDKTSIYNVYYSVNNVEVQYRKATYAELIEILSTNLKIILDFIKQFSPGVVLINGNFKLDEDMSMGFESKKSRLYGAIIDKHIDKLKVYRYTNTIPLYGDIYYTVYKVKTK